VGAQVSRPNLAKNSGVDGAKAPAISDVWREVRARLKSEYGPAVFSAELARLRVVDNGPSAVILVAPTAFSKSWVEDHAGARIRALWASFDSARRMVEVLSDRDLATSAAPQAEEADEAEPVRQDTAAHAGNVTAMPRDRSGRRSGERFTFDTFMVGPSNELAAVAAKSVINASPSPFNPAFFYGDYGVGKTHLLNAIAHSVELGGQRRKALYLTAEEFLSGFVSAMRARDTMAFKDRVRNVDVLLIDDVHFIAGKPKTEDEFLHTILALMADDRQVILASHSAPGDLPVCDPRLASLLRGGFACQMMKPDLDLRRKILDCKVAQAEKHYPDLDVPEAVRDFLAARITTSARELEGVLNNVIARTALMGRDVTLETVEEALRELAITGERKVTVDDIQRTVAQHFNVKVADIVSKRRNKAIVTPRHIAMYLAKTLTTRSLPDIGRRFGGRDHSTVIHAVKKVVTLIEDDDAMAALIEQLTRELGG